MQAIAGAAVFDARYPRASDSPHDAGGLQLAVERSLRAGRTLAVVVLHLSALVPPAPRPHHRRVARAVLDDAAARFDGQVFVQASGDVALLCRAEGMAGTAETLARLFRIDAPCADALLTLWRLPGDAAAIAAYADQASVASLDPPPNPLIVPGPRAAANQVIRQQVAIRIDGHMRLLFRQVMTSDGTASPSLDAALIGYVAGRPPRDGIPFHLGLTLAGARSDGLADLRRDAVAPNIVVELSLRDACADPAGFGSARAALRRLGVTSMLHAGGPLALSLTRPDMAGVDLLRLDWSSRIPDLPRHDAVALADAIGRFGPDRVVLGGADTEAALAWGMAQGIRCFQGAHVDAMLAAARLRACAAADPCTMRECNVRQCASRAAATTLEGQAGCRDLAMLETSGLVR